MTESPATDREKVAPIKAAQYVRMSTEHQKYSTENQAEIINLYAAQRGFEIVLRIPVIVGTHSTRWWAPIPRDRGRRIRPTSAWSQALV
jgi:hypothetical protein